MHDCRIACAAFEEADHAACRVVRTGGIAIALAHANAEIVRQVLVLLECPQGKVNGVHVQLALALGANQALLHPLVATFAAFDGGLNGL